LAEREWFSMAPRADPHRTGFNGSRVGFSGESGKDNDLHEESDDGKLQG